MVKLTDYLGTLISSVNQGRVLADIESARIAQVYSQDELLKHFPVPRFRAQNIELDIPFAIDGFNEKPAKDYQPIENTSFNQLTYSCFKDAAKIKALPRERSKKLIAQIAESSRKLETDLKSGASKEGAFKEYSETMEHTFKTTFKHGKTRRETSHNAELSFQNMLKEKLLPQIQVEERSRELENANVIVEAAQLREIPNENIVRVKMRLYEEGMEWHTSEDANGTIKTSLLPE